ncbi:hypothetical protein HDU80_007832 [Chytriomyces hyalinus]|nr:hypothetical protein HDU80_007832 [Chytriomyces hyalinus]
MRLKKDGLSILMGGDFNVAAEATDIHPRVIPLISSGFQDAERVLLRALLQYLHDFWREEHPDARDFTTWFYLDRRRNEGMRYDMILGSEQIALSICHAHEFTASDHVPVVLHTRLNSLHADFLHLMYEEGSMFGDDKSDAISESGFHACLRCGTSDESEGSTECLRCMEAVSEGFSGFDSEEDGLESLNLGGSVQGLFDDEYSCSESDEGSFNGFENTTDTESSSSDSGVDSEESCGTTAGDVKGDSLSHQFVSVTSFFHKGKELDLKSRFELTEGELVVGVAMPLQYEKVGSVSLLGEDCVESTNPLLCTDGAFVFDLNE